MIAKVGDLYEFYKGYPRFRCILKVARVSGYNPTSEVWFDDGSWSMQWNLSDDSKVIVFTQQLVTD